MSTHLVWLSRRQEPGIAAVLLGSYFILSAQLNNLLLVVLPLIIFWRYWRLQAPLSNYWLQALSVVAVVIVVVVGINDGIMSALMHLIFIGFALKTLELHQRRDVLIWVATSWFLLALGLVFNPSMLWGLYCAALLLVSWGLLVAAQVPQQRFVLWRNQVFRTCLIAAPLGFALFMVMPKLAPLWQVPSLNSATIGLSDKVAPGDITNLMRRDDLMFRAQLTQRLPNAQLYWRVYSHEAFDGREWRIGEWQIPNFAATASKPSSGERYQLLLQPSSHQALPLLYWPAWVEAAQPSRDDQWQLSQAPTQQQRVQVVSKNGASEQSLPVYRERLLQQLPAISPRLREFALQLAQQYPDPADRVAALMRHIQQQPFRYTLTPPPMPNDYLDRFWFDTQAGFCAHYAAVTAVILRASGVPTRVVSGFQGGEWLENEQAVVSVRAYDAHAWVEYWHPTLGWSWFDPTAAVSPERVELGMAQGLSEQFAAQRPWSFWRSQQLWLVKLQAQVNLWDYRWSSWLMGFDNQRQQQWVSNLLDKWRWVLAALGAALLLWVTLHLGLKQWRYWRQPAVWRDWLMIEAYFAKRGCVRTPCESAWQFLMRAQSSLQMQQLNQLWHQRYYQQDTQLLREEFLQLWQQVKAQVVNEVGRAN